MSRLTRFFEPMFFIHEKNPGFLKQAFQRPRQMEPPGIFTRLMFGEHIHPQPD
jgi:hypothetical protein